jgi:hypothetical protein
LWRSIDFGYFGAIIPSLRSGLVVCHRIAYQDELNGIPADSLVCLISPHAKGLS